ncbi:hypothetical protein H072_3391 [Dactylellina haptotyla CBS 200.50]|uniref:Uncharacterized protein n=1 Tax=Dactylellina haptotyla (strain CBS 200.50) TaxID=1284197 RepID=S8C4L7_DACHA|nr:hypothetical protein H072_3391 [Dactylellina haptotyla CBS 200.50]
MENKNKPPEPSRLTFEGLPPEIRNQIYSYLLDIKNCDKSVDDNAVQKSHLYPNILRTNKKIYRDAHGVLYGASGPVVTVTYYDSYVKKNLEDDIVYFFPSRYSRSVAGRQLHIIVRPTFISKEERQPYVFVLVGMENIRRFSRYLRFLNWSQNDGRGIYYEFNFEPYDNALREVTVSKEATAKIQYTLAVPFANQASVQTCTSQGLIDTQLETTFLARMNDTTMWVRGEIFDITYLYLTVYNEAFRYWTKGDLDQALARYRYLHRVFARIAHANPQISLPANPSDYALHKQLSKLVLFTNFDRLLATLLGRYYGTLKCARFIRQPKEAAYKMILPEVEEFACIMQAAPASFPKGIASTFWHVTAVAQALLGKPRNEIIVSYDLAIRGSNKTSKEKKMQSRQLVVEASEMDSKLGDDIIEKLVKNLSQRPLSISINLKHSDVTVSNERYILNKLNYKGRLFENWVNPRILESIDPNTGEKITRGDKAEKNICESLLAEIDADLEATAQRMRSTVYIGSRSFALKGSCEPVQDKEDPTQLTLPLPMGDLPNLVSGHPTETQGAVPPTSNEIDDPAL